MPSWGFRIKQLREDHHYTQEELAEKAGLTRSHLSRIEADDYQSLKVEHLNSLASAFEMTPANLSAYLFGGDKPPDLPEANRTAPPIRIPVYTAFPFHAGSPTQPVEYVHRAISRPSPKHIEGYICHGDCLAPIIEEGDIIIIDREGQIDNGDIVACLMNDELHLARLRKVADELWLENNNGRYRFQECVIAAPVIEVIKRLK
jgi:transcriptional regulator with XRE-family HTH domain